MPISDVNNSGEIRNSDVASAPHREYVVPTLTRFGTLADLTRASGTKNLNDGQGTPPGCGANQFATSCFNPGG